MKLIRHSVIVPIENNSGLSMMGTPVILDTQEAETERIIVQGQPGKKVIGTPSQLIKAEHGGTDLSSQLLGKNK
jgi:hypothetical protein